MKFDPSNLNYRSARSRYAAAFHEPANYVGLASLVALSAALLNPLPLLAGVVAEVAYLLFVPDTNWFTNRLDAKFDAEVKAHRQALKSKIFPKVREEVSTRFLWLEQARAQIEQTSDVKDKWFREALRKLDFLLEKYLEFGDREAEFLNYLFSLIREANSSMSQDEIRRLPPVVRLQNSAPASPANMAITPTDVKRMIESIQSHYEEEIQSLATQLETETVLATKDILTKRKEVLSRRREFILRLSDMLVNLRHQMELIAETFGLINDEMRARSPEQVLADIDEVVLQATSLTDALDMVTPADQVVAKL